MIKKVAFAVIALIFVSLLGLYFLDSNRWDTVRILEPQNKLCSKDYMLSSLNVTSIAQDNALGQKVKDSRTPCKGKSIVD